MPAPSAAYILSMLNPYAGFKPDSSGGIAVGQLGLQNRRLAEEKRQADAESARKDEYLGFQQHQWEMGQANQLRDDQVKAFTAFQAAVDSGDTEQAALAANALRMYGVGVEAYGGEEPTQQPPAAPNAMSAMAQFSPTAMVAQSQARPANKAPSKPMSAADQQTARELDELGKSASVAPYNPFAALPAATMPRPGPQRPEELLAPQAQPAPPNALEGDAGIRPGPARAQFMAGQEPQPGGAATDAEPAAAAKPMRGYRLDFGGTVIDIDPESIRDRQRQRVRGVLEPLVKSASTEGERAAARAALEAAENAVGIVPPQEAVKLGITSYENELNRNAALERAKVGGRRGGTVVMGGGFGGVEGLTKEGAQNLGTLRDDIEAYVGKYESSNDVKVARSVVDNGQKIQELLKSNNSLADWAASKQLIKDYLKGAVSDYDAKEFRSAAGKLVALEQEFNSWFEGGAAPEDMRRKLAEVTVLTNEYYRKKIERIAQQARDVAVNDFTFTDRMTPDQQRKFGDTVYFRISGRKPPGGGGGGGAPAKSDGRPAPAARSAPVSEKQRRAAELKAKLGRK